MPNTFSSKRVYFILFFAFIGVLCYSMFLSRHYIPGYYLEYLINNPEKIGGSYNDDMEREYAALDAVKKYRGESHAIKRLLVSMKSEDQFIKGRAIMCLGIMAEYNNEAMSTLTLLAEDRSLPDSLTIEARACLDYVRKVQEWQAAP